jgi:hypothetical protein
MNHYLIELKYKLIYFYIMGNNPLWVDFFAAYQDRWQLTP